MYFVLHEHPDYQLMAIKEVTYYEILLYTVLTLAVCAAFFRMRDLKFQRKTGNGELKNNFKYVFKRLKLKIFRPSFFNDKIGLHSTSYGRNRCLCLWHVQHNGECFCITRQFTW